MIHNESNRPASDRTVALRNAFEHRATWMSMLIDAAKEKGLDTSFAREAILKCGCMHGTTTFPITGDIEEWTKVFATDDIKNIFDMDVETTENEMVATFHYCPLVKAWQKLGYDEAYIAELCDIAMEGDRGIVSENPHLEFHLGDTIGAGCACCKVTVSKSGK